MGKCIRKFYEELVKTDAYTFEVKVRLGMSYRRLRESLLPASFTAGGTPRRSEAAEGPAEETGAGDEGEGPATERTQPGSVSPEQAGGAVPGATETQQDAQGWLNATSRFVPTSTLYKFFFFCACHHTRFIHTDPSVRFDRGCCKRFWAPDPERFNYVSLGWGGAFGALLHYTPGTRVRVTARVFYVLHASSWGFLWALRFPPTGQNHAWVSWSYQSACELSPALCP